MTTVPYIAMFLIYGSLFLILGAFLLSFYLLYAIPLSRIGKKLGYDKNFLPWIPITDFFALYTLGDLPGIKDFSINPAFDRFLKIRTRKRSFIIYVTLSLTTIILPIALISIIFVIFMACILLSEQFNLRFAEPLALFFVVIGYILFIFSAIALSYITSAYSIILHYVYLRDLSDILCPDKDNNKVTSLIIAIINSFTAGFAIPIYLLILSKNDPLPEEPSEPYEEDIPSGDKPETDEEAHQTETQPVVHEEA